MKTIKILLVIFFFFISTNKIESCTIFYIEKNGIVLAGNNEDWENPASMMFFYPAKNGKNGWLKFGWGSGFPQGGMNDKGVFWDGTSGPHLAMPISEASKTKLTTPIMQKVIEECDNMEDAETIFSQYFCEDQYKAQYLVGDSTGNSAIVEGDNIINKTKNYHVLTNFYQSNPDLGGYPCWRFNKACEMLDDIDNLTAYYTGSILASTHQEGKYPTQYSNIYDLKKLRIYLFHFHNYEEFVIIDLQKELEKGERSYNIPELFSNIKINSPVNGEIVNASSVNFLWDAFPDNKYDIIYSTHPNFEDSEIVEYLSINKGASKPNLALIPVFTLFLFVGIKSSRFFPVVVLLFFISGAHCDKNEVNVVEEKQTILHSKAVENLLPGTTYYWKINARTTLQNNFFSETIVNLFTTK